MRDHVHLREAGAIVSLQHIKLGNPHWPGIQVRLLHALVLVTTNMEILTVALIGLALARRQIVTLPDAPLGQAGGAALYARAVFEHVRLDVYDLSLQFYERRHGTLARRRSFEAGQGFGVANALCIGYYTSEERMQVFVSTEMGAVRSYLLDYDGHQVHVLYRRTVGRVRAFPTWDDKGRFGIREQEWHIDKSVNGKVMPVTPYTSERTILIKPTAGATGTSARRSRERAEPRAMGEKPPLPTSVRSASTGPP